MFAREDDTRAGFAWAVPHIDFHVGGAQHMGRARQAYLSFETFIIV